MTRMHMQAGVIVPTTVADSVARDAAELSDARLQVGDCLMAGFGCSFTRPIEVKPNVMIV
jgi:hypothetical protein